MTEQLKSLFSDACFYGCYVNESDSCRGSCWDTCGAIMDIIGKEHPAYQLLASAGGCALSCDGEGFFSFILDAKACFAD